MKINFIDSDKTYYKVLKRIEDLVDLTPEVDTSEGKELEFLVKLINDYEDKHYDA